MHFVSNIIGIQFNENFGSGFPIDTDYRKHEYGLPS